MILRKTECADCTYGERYVGDTAFQQAKNHAQRLGHRTKILAASEGEQDTVYDYRPTVEKEN